MGTMLRIELKCPEPQSGGLTIILHYAHKLVAIIGIEPIYHRL